uniref:G protein-coupled receptor n=1 Tax=Heterorhabditis bacteriophora TaxID=37862 RepID=A0A1I7X436_HETBA
MAVLIWRIDVWPFFLEFYSGNNTQPGPSMLENAVVYQIYAIFGYLVELLTLFWMYTIITRSTQEMKLYKICLLKLAICDLIFSFNLTTVLAPDVLFPLPCCVVLGLSRHFGRFGGICGLYVTLASGVTIFTAINDCSYLRAAI